MQRHRFRAMGTDVHVIVVDGVAGHLDHAEREVRDRERRWSRFLPDSEVSILNASAGRPVVVSADTFELVAAAVDAFHFTGGRFDPTILGSMVAAGYDRSLELVGEPAGPGPRTRHLPAPTPEGVELFAELHAVRLPPGVGLDLGGIAKGATADAIVAEIMADGAAGCCVNLGGDLRAAGRSPGDGGWVVDLECPGADRTELMRLAGGAVCTSTTLLRRWRDGDEHHLRDPRTGAPLRTGLCSVTVVDGRARRAEVLAKLALAAGPEQAAEALAAHHATGLLVHDDGTVVVLDGMPSFLVDRGQAG